MTYPPRSRFSVLVHFPIELLLLVGIGPSGFSQDSRSLITCDKDSLSLLEARVKADTDTIRRLGAGSSVSSLEEWAKLGTAQKEKLVKDSLSAATNVFADQLLDAPKLLLNRQVIYGVNLPNGLGSLGTGQANTIIGRLPQGAIRDKLSPILRKLSSYSDKERTLKTLELHSQFVSALKEAALMETAETTVDKAKGLMSFAATVAGKYNFAVTLGNTLFDVGQNGLFLYMMGKSVGTLADASESQLDSLRAVSSHLTSNVQALRSCRAALAKSSEGQNQTGLNPDFKAALEAEKWIAAKAANDPRWIRFYANKYPDGSYIPAVGPCRGIGFLDPGTGAVVSSSIDECGVDPSKALKVNLSVPQERNASGGSEVSTVSDDKATPATSSNRGAEIIEEKLPGPAADVPEISFSPSTSSEIEVLWGGHHRTVIYFI